MKFIVIGLGSFGGNLSLQLFAHGHEVIGIDSNPSIVEEYKSQRTATVCLNATEEAAIRSQPILEVDAVIVAIGEDWSASIQTTALLKTLGVRHIIGRSLSKLHVMVLKGLGIIDVFNPEYEAAKAIANRVISKHVVSTYNLGNDVAINEIEVPAMFIGQTTEDIDLRKNFGLNLIAVRHTEVKTGFTGTVNETTATIYEFDKPYTFAKGDFMVVCGTTYQTEKLIALIK